jgi:ubiquinone/menaquinone biosynthesis C-methylase UbiE
MDEYTERQRQWLEQRYKTTDLNGIYKSHAPIYGFSKEHLFLGLYKNNYNILKQIERITSEYRIDSFLEVGCAEGYTAHLIKEIFGFQVEVCDLSSEAINRAGEIYGLEGFVADVQNMEIIKNNSFDLVLCSETIEHVPNPERAFRELKRITKKALIITVPAASNKKEKQQFISPDEPQAHLNIFTKNDIKELIQGAKIQGMGLIWLNRIEGLFTTYNRNIFVCKSKLKKLIYRIIKLFFPLTRRIYNVSIAKIFIRLDYLLLSILTGKVATYLVLFKKIHPEFKKKSRIRNNLLDYILDQSKVSPYSLNSDL